ncbi:Filamentous hemagglutinin family outer membrane protein [Verrucomicrobia bacterium]|nr:Filamentous hemagglutinin family outer membrane protein [Verrucomicrobiota bacterium]
MTKQLPTPKTEADSPSAGFARCRKATFRLSSFVSALVCASASFLVFGAQANPQGLTVVAVSAAAQSSGTQLNVTASAGAFLDWRSFNIQNGETTRFIQPSASSIVVNRVSAGTPSQIWGNLTANGTVILANAAGFYFGPNSMIKVGGSFIATTAPLAPDFGPGASWQFSGMPPLASIVNYGQVSAGDGRSLFLIAEQVENHGDLSAPGGDIGLYAGKQVLLSERPDGRGLSAKVQVGSGTVDNLGRIVADAGSIALQAQVVNQNGIIQADSVQNRNGVIELVAADQLNLGANSQILARGDDATPGSSGGSVKLESKENFTDARGSSVVTSGGALGGNGGNVELSALNILSLNSSMVAWAQPGWAGGQLLLDPATITLATTGQGSAGNGTVPYNQGPGTLALNVNTAFRNLSFAQITLEATGNITVSQNTTWNLTTSTALTSGHLTLEAGGDIIFGNKASIFDANDWSVTLEAGVSFPSGSIQSGTGNIYLNGGSGRAQSGAIQTAQGSINLSAGNSILVGSGYVRTTGGGSISATALAGDINAGTANGGYQFSIFGSSVSQNLGGISTAAGGNVALDAGRNIISLPTVPANQPPGGSGAYGPQPGNVTLIAGSQISGNFNLANGVGTILAGVQVDNPTDPKNGQVTQVLNPDASVGNSTHGVALSLISGSWNVWAADNIFLSEVRNPNGTFNANQLTVPTGQFPGNTDQTSVPTRVPFLYNYAPDAAANLWAGSAITLMGQNLPRVNGGNEGTSPVYPPILNLNAGAGGISLLNSIVLYPSSQGALQIATRDGGSLTGAFQATTLTGITMSDSGLPNYDSFAQGDAVVPLHLQDPNPVSLDISGNIETFHLGVPTFANINVGGSTFNFGFLGRNLSPAQATTITVAGDITYQGDLTSIPVTEALPAALFNPALCTDAEVAAKLSYNAATATLSFIGQMTASEESFLLNPSVTTLNGARQPVTTSLALDAAQQAEIASLYTASQRASLGDQGLTLSGSGQFDIAAHNIDLGVSGGISVLAPDAPLAAISPYGANIRVVASGDLDMTSTVIANESLRGSIQLTVGGALDVGGEFTLFGDPNAPKGIFTTSGGNVSVTAYGDVNVNGSRIAAYNGGNIEVVSETGSVNAGSGGSGYVSMNSLELDKTGHLISISASIPGSGILATTLPGSTAPTLGNITIDAPEGSINASLGGIIQIAFNGADTRTSLISLDAGHDINAGGSGIIGSDINLKAGGNITGLIVGSGTVNVAAGLNITATTFGGNGVSESAGGAVSGTVIGTSVSVSGESVTAALVGNAVTASGNTTGAKEGVPQSNVAKDDAKVAEDASQTTASASSQDGDDLDQNKKRAGLPRLAKTIGRVTVLLPVKPN